MAGSSPPSATQLLERSAALLSSITEFEDYLMAEKRAMATDILDILRPFKGTVQAEQNSLQRLVVADPASEQTIHNLRSSNLPFQEVVWSTARASRGLIGLQKRFFREREQAPPILHEPDSPTTRVPSSAASTVSTEVGGNRSKKQRKRKTKRKAVLVEVVSEQGLMWTKVSTVSEATLLFQKAKAGWEADEWQSSSEDGVDGSGSNGKISAVKSKKPIKIYPEGIEPPEPQSDDESSDDGYFFGRIELVRVAQELMRVSRATRVRFSHPQVRIHLPNIQAGVSEVIDEILDDLRATGADVKCGPLDEPVLPFEDMIPPLRPRITPTINLDCTILLALISDLSHRDPDEIALPDNPHPSLLHQIEVERSTPLLQKVLYPGLQRATRFVTSSKSATRMWQIVNTIGTMDERRRAEALFAVGDGKKGPVGKGGGSSVSAAELCAQLSALSSHEVPNLPLPIDVIEGGIIGGAGSGAGPATSGSNRQNRKTSQRASKISKDMIKNRTDGSDSCALDTVSVPPSVLLPVARELSEINRSVFLLGWTRGWTTVTSNRLAVRSIESLLSHELDALEKKGPGAAGGVAAAAIIRHHHNQHGSDHDHNVNVNVNVNVNSDDTTPIPLPLLWTVDIARSLVGKEGGRAS